MNLRTDIIWKSSSQKTELSTFFSRRRHIDETDPRIAHVGFTLMVGFSDVPASTHEVLDL